MVVLVTAFGFFLLYEGVVTATAMKDNYSITMHFSMAWVFAALPTAGFIFLLYQFQKIFRRKDWAATCIWAVWVVVLAACGVHWGISPRTPGPADRCSGLCRDLFYGGQRAYFGRHRPGLSRLPSGPGQYPAPDRADHDYWREGLLCPAAVPLFILVGELMNTGDITTRLVNFARALVGHMRGSLGISTVLGEYIFSGISGASVADVSAMGSILIPAMKRGGYRPEQAVWIVASASPWGCLYPPYSHGCAGKSDQSLRGGVVRRRTCWLPAWHCR